LSCNFSWSFSLRGSAPGVLLRNQRGPPPREVANCSGRLVPGKMRTQVWSRSAGGSIGKVVAWICHSFSSSHKTRLEARSNARSPRSYQKTENKSQHGYDYLNVSGGSCLANRLRQSGRTEILRASSSLSFLKVAECGPSHLECSPRLRPLPTPQCALLSSAFAAWLIISLCRCDRVANPRLHVGRAGQLAIQCLL
jgi:hypothetical protein